MYIDLKKVNVCSWKYDFKNWPMFNTIVVDKLHNVSKVSLVHSCDYILMFCSNIVAQLFALLATINHLRYTVAKQFNMSLFQQFRRVLIDLNLIKNCDIWSSGTACQ